MHYKADLGLFYRKGLFCPKAGKDPSDLLRAAKLLGERRAKRGAKFASQGQTSAPEENKPKAAKLAKK